MTDIRELLKRARAQLVPSEWPVDWGIGPLCEEIDAALAAPSDEPGQPTDVPMRDGYVPVRKSVLIESDHMAMLIDSLPSAFNALFDADGEYAGGGAAVDGWTDQMRAMRAAAYEYRKRRDQAPTTGPLSDVHGTAAARDVLAEAHADLRAERDDYRARYETLKRRIDEQSSSLGYEDEEALAEQLARDANLRAENERLREALLGAARSAEALKRDCGMDPESPQAIRNAQYMAISYAARAALEHKHG